MGRNKSYCANDDPEYDDGWGRRPDETDDDFEERIEDWNDFLDILND